MVTRILLLGLAGLALGAPLLLARPAVQAPAAPAPQAADGSIFGEPLVVNGKRVPDAEIQRFLIYGPCRLQLELFRVGLIIEDELDRRARDEASLSVEPLVGPAAREAAEKAIASRAAAQPFESPEARARALDQELGRQRAARLQDPEVRAAWQKKRDAERKLLDEQLVPTDEEFEAEFQRTLEEFKKSYPVLDVAAEVSRAFRSVPWYRDNLRQLLYFDRVFYPENPDEWPVSTIEAVRADSGDTLLNDAHQSYQMRREHADKTGEPLPKEDGIYVNMMRQIVRDALFATIDWKTAFDGIPDDLVLTADRDFDGQPDLVVRTAELWEKVKDTVTQAEIDDAKRWFVTSIATHDRLAKEGALLAPDERKQALSDLKKQFEGTYFTVDLMATQTYFFPSTESFLEYHVMLEGYRKKIAPLLANQENGDISALLRSHLDTANRIMGLGQVDVEVLLVSAFDIPNFRWKDDGWRTAKAKAEAIKARLDANIAEYDAERAKRAQAQAEGREYAPAQPLVEPFRFWSDQLNEHSEYWDPPAPDGQGQRGSDVAMKNRGRFGLRYRNDLQGFVGESPYTHWATGASITDFVFSEQAENTVAGPFRGPQGYYITRVQRRTPPTRPLNLGDPKHIELLRDDYVRTSFVTYAREARKSADVRGFEFGY
ncbi:MAG: hypothetical protein JNK02_16050 [Planctomycetes bacterium]|nr:hypothetical protein [Planctomycetota bacterium]